MPKASYFLTSEACPQGTLHRFCQKLKGYCGGIKTSAPRTAWLPAPASNPLPDIAGPTRTSRQRAKEAARVDALRASLAEEEKRLSLKEALSGALYQLQGPINLVAATQNTLRRRNSDHQHDALIEALQHILDSGLASVATLQNSLPQADTENPAPVNLNQILYEALSLTAPALREHGILVNWHPVPELPPLHGLENRLRVLFKQLIDNAVDAMWQDGGPRRELSFFTCSNGSEIHVCIEDTGPGIPAHLHVKVFEPFFSTRAGETRRHVGMGLTWGREVVNQHRGLIQIDPDYAQGCRIHVRFPLQAPAEPLPLAV
ncbi:nitrogen fixation negative regulator NifL [Methylococcus sp. EFPC2]|uniref:nitrogen fixation negative regulator NifL n=1 Tax=Methylococcus sp. EFPC2 TaxID=2812648 RepID=UPI00196779AF|nr:nitrogen fixation negative regulator NifL [Methylococcus sp. EFPC2]QSA99219.1 nitrogen fixation negative regulator NifL [Methylococcus sp. EFPC2]